MENRINKAVVSIAAAIWFYFTWTLLDKTTKIYDAYLQLVNLYYQLVGGSGTHITFNSSELLLISILLFAVVLVGSLTMKDN